jgi:hypothetical protein
MIETVSGEPRHRPEVVARNQGSTPFPCGGQHWSLTRRPDGLPAIARWRGARQGASEVHA